MTAAAWITAAAVAGLIGACSAGGRRAADQVDVLATVDDAGVVTRLAPGEIIITAASIVHPAATDSATVTVAEQPVETRTLRPGAFTAFSGGLLVGAHPEAIGDPITVEVAWFQLPACLR